VRTGPHLEAGAMPARPRHCERRGHAARCPPHARHGPLITPLGRRRAGREGELYRLEPGDRPRPRPRANPSREGCGVDDRRGPGVPASRHATAPRGPA
jgi:hypothetical protein